MSRINDCTPLADIIEVMEPGNAFRGKRFSITGHLGRPRDQIVHIIELCGGQFDKAPTYGTHYLITNKDWNTGAINGSKSNKLRKAEQLGCRIISEETFYNMLMANSEVNLNKDNE